MRLSIRFVLPLVISLCAIAYGVIPLVDSLTQRWFVRDIDIRTLLIKNAIKDDLIDGLRKSDPKRVEATFKTFMQDERLFAVAFCGDAAFMQYRTTGFPPEIPCNVYDDLEPHSRIIENKTGPMHVSSHPIFESERYYGRLLLVHDMSFVKRRTSETKTYIFYFFILLGIVISFITVVIAQLSFKGWVKGLRSVLKGENLTSETSDTTAEMRPVLKDLNFLIKELETDKRIRDETQISWSPKTLKEILTHDLKGDEIITVSNREPYVHIRKNGKIEIQVPASGLVTALEPVMRACSGTWIAHGTGDADREVVDSADHVQVPPENPKYQIRRVWLNAEEEKGYYDGFANEGLWALCHIAHVRPVFRSQDWDQYLAVNKKFAQAVVDEATTDDPVILVQDYHFALLPKMIRQKLPRATIITFWHIPFPNPEVFGVCPWREELLDGLLSSNILGFHTRFHCNNFLDTVDRLIESRVDRENSTITYQGSLTAVNHYPISLEHPIKWLATLKSVEDCTEAIKARHSISRTCKIGLGVDRLDYTKGILEKFTAVERLLELDSSLIGKFSLVQVAAPTRSSIHQYQQFLVEVQFTVDRINRRFSKGSYQPIYLVVGHQEPPEVYEYYRAADVCIVSSLHDGMNLVAKEYLAARDDEKGVLILSQFTGASKELHEALVINPYDIDQFAAAIHLAIRMSAEEQKRRMRTMRSLIQEFNVYRWAGRMLLDAASVRHRKWFLERASGNSQDRLRQEQ